MISGDYQLLTSIFFIGRKIALSFFDGTGYVHHNFRKPIEVIFHLGFWSGNGHSACSIPGFIFDFD